MQENPAEPAARTSGTAAPQPVRRSARRSRRAAGKADAPGSTAPVGTAPVGTTPVGTAPVGEDAAACDALAALGVAEAQLFAARNRALVECQVTSDRARGPRGHDRFLELDIAGTLRIGQIAASHQLHEATRLVHHLPLLLQSLTDGWALLAQARSVLDATRNATPAVTHEVDRQTHALLARDGDSWYGPAWRTKVNRIVTTVESQLEPAAVQQRLADAAASRRVATRTEPDGMASLWALLPAAQLLAFNQGLDELTRRQAHADRTPPTDPAPAVAPPAPTTPPPVEATTRPATTTARATATATPTQTAPPAEPDPATPATPAPPAPPATQAPTATDLTRLAQLFPTDILLLADTPEPHYRPSTALDRLVRTRDPLCTGPGCATSSTRTSPSRPDLDHLDPWPHGPTTAHNTHPNSRRCHRAKTLTWTVRRHRNGTTLWTSPTGRSYLTPSPYQPPPGLGPVLPTPPPPPPEPTTTWTWHPHPDPADPAATVSPSPTSPPDDENDPPPF